MNHAYVKNDTVAAEGNKATIDALNAATGQHYTVSWLAKTPAEEKAAMGVYEIVENPPDKVLYVDCYALGAVYDKPRDSVHRLYSQVEWELERARAECKADATREYRVFSNATIKVQGYEFSTSYTAYIDITKGIEREKLEGPFYSVTRAGERVHFTAELLADVESAIYNYRKNCMNNEESLYRQADEAQSITELRAVDTRSGWT